jgi:small subunit ribosomal protein S21
MTRVRITARRGEPIDRMIRRLRRRLEREGIMKEFKKHQFYEKPSAKNRREERKSRSRARKREAEEGGGRPT